jgi:WD40 repeat protein
VIRTFEGRKRPVFSLSFSPDGKLLASASIDGTVRLWDVAAAREVQMFTGHADAVGSVCFSPDGKLLFFGSDGRTIKIWSVK